VNNKYVIEHEFSYGWDLLNDQEVDAYDTRAEAQDAIDELVYQIGDSDSEDYRVKKSGCLCPYLPEVMFSNLIGRMTQTILKQIARLMIFLGRT